MLVGMKNNTGTGTSYRYTHSQLESFSPNSTTGTLQPLNGLLRRRVSCSTPTTSNHTSAKMYPCVLFGSSCHRYQHDHRHFNTVADLKKDIKEHLRPYHCSICPYRISKLNHINRHLKFSEKRNWQCRPTTSQENLLRLSDASAAMLITALDDARSYQDVCDAVKACLPGDSYFSPGSCPTNTGAQVPPVTTPNRDTTLIPEHAHSHLYSQSQSPQECLGFLERHEQETTYSSLPGQSVPFPQNEPLMATPDFADIGIPVFTQDQTAVSTYGSYEGTPPLLHTPQYIMDMNVGSQPGLPLEPLPSANMNFGFIRSPDLDGSFVGPPQNESRSFDPQFSYFQYPRSLL